MIWTMLTIGASAASLIALIIAILSTSWPFHIKTIVASASALGILFTLISYFRQIYAKSIYGNFEWQWAGENWIGIVSIKKNEDNKTIAEVDMKKFIKKQRVEGKGEYEAIQLMQNTSEGSIVGNKDGFKLKLPVRKNILDENNNIIGETSQNIEANLVPIEAYAGIANYIYQDGSIARGDMILVRYNSGIRFY